MFRTSEYLPKPTREDLRKQIRTCINEIAAAISEAQDTLWELEDTIDCLSRVERDQIQ